MDERRVIFTITDLNGEYYSQDLYTEKQEEKISNDEIMKKFVGKYKGDEASFTIDKYKVGGSEVIMPIDVVLDLPGWGDRKDEFFINDIKNYSDN
ncbi:MAG: hypothetical protein MJ246_07795 [Clostridia bacterium]|nr:hypothetical protein [Clostridia bacterium]